jgi:hypothetical protein
MPIPRAIFSEKPGGEYLDKAQLDIWGTVFGMAFMNYGDAFYAFGWVGIILNGLFIGWLSKVFWLQFEQKKDNFYNLLALALYNGSTYVFISRGYLAQEITILFMFTLVPLFLYKKIYKYIK